MSKTLILLGALSYGTPAFGPVVLQQNESAVLDDKLADLLLEDIRYSEGDGIEIHTFREAPAGHKPTYDFTTGAVTKGFEDPSAFAPPSVHKHASPTRHQIEEAGDPDGGEGGEDGDEGGDESEQKGKGDLTADELATKNTATAAPAARKAVQRVSPVAGKSKK